MKTYLILTVAHAVLADIERAKRDGVVTIGEALDIGYHAAKSVCEALGVMSHPLFEVRKRRNVGALTMQNADLKKD